MTLTEWITRTYKPERLSGRGADYELVVVKSHQEDLEKYGNTVISRHESVTGKAEYYPEEMVI